LVAPYYRGQLRSLPWIELQRAKGEAGQYAAKVTQPHADTPTVVTFDGLGRAVGVVANNGDGGLLKTSTGYDVAGNPISVTDPRGLEVVRRRFDMLGRPTLVVSSEAG